jgi:hypothetical protein
MRPRREYNINWGIIVTIWGTITMATTRMNNVLRPGARCRAKPNPANALEITTISVYMLASISERPA